MNQGESSGLPPYLVENLPPHAAPPPKDAEPSPPRMRIVGVIALLLASAAVASTITIAYSHKSRSSATTSATAPSTSIPSNQIFSVGEPTSFDGWVITVNHYAFASTVAQYRPVANRRWLVVDARLKNSTNAALSFSSDMIEARALDPEGESAFVSAMGGTTGWQIPSYGSVDARFVFSVPAATRTAYTLVVHRDVVSGKVRGDAVEVNLNCC